MFVSIDIVKVIGALFLVPIHREMTTLEEANGCHVA